MNYLLLLAGGIGSRMQSKNGIPKQFLTINDRPVIIHTLENMLNIKSIDKIVIVCNPRYVGYIADLLDEYIEVDSNKVYVTGGGGSRIESVLNGLNYISSSFNTDNDDIFIALDAVRPLISERIILENIENAKKTKASTTVLPTQETILLVDEDTKLLRDAIDRRITFTGQSPDAFNLNYFNRCIKNIDPESLQKFTSLTEVILHNSGEVATVIGDKENIKITTPFDLVLAKAIMNKEEYV